MRAPTTRPPHSCAYEYHGEANEGNLTGTIPGSGKGHEQKDERAGGHGKRADKNQLAQIVRLSDFLGEIHRGVHKLEKIRDA